MTKIYRITGIGINPIFITEDMIDRYTDLAKAASPLYRIDQELLPINPNEEKIKGGYRLWIADSEGKVQVNANVPLELYLTETENVILPHGRALLVWGRSVKEAEGAAWRLLTKQG